MSIVGQNVQAALSADGKTLSIQVDLSQEGKPSASGKSMVIATTGGNIPVADGIKMGLNIYKPVAAGIARAKE